MEYQDINTGKGTMFVTLLSTVNTDGTDEKNSVGMFAEKLVAENGASYKIGDGRHPKQKLKFISKRTDRKYNWVGKLFGSAKCVVVTIKFRLTGR